MVRRTKSKKRSNRKTKVKRYRRAVQWENGQRTEVSMLHDKGYDLEMIRDFLDQLLLELRVQHYENLQVLKRLDSGIKGLEAAEIGIVPKFVDQLQHFQMKHHSALICVTAIDERGVSEEEASEAVRAMVQAKSEKRDEQIGHLESLQELFEEALFCARLPFGLTRDGDFVQPVTKVKIADLLEEVWHEEDD